MALGGEKGESEYTGVLRYLRRTHSGSEVPAMLCVTETAERKHLNEHLGGRRGAKTEPMLLFDDPPVAIVHSVPMADIKQRVAR